MLPLFSIKINFGKKCCQCNARLGMTSTTTFRLLYKCLNDLEGDTHSDHVEGAEAGKSGEPTLCLPPVLTAHNLWSKGGAACWCHLVGEETIFIFLGIPDRHYNEAEN